MFAFAIWDSARKTLFCARDRLGKKPFYYFWDGRLFAFASEIKALFEHPAISPRFNASLLPEHLAFGYTSGEDTLFSGVRKLMPGHHLTLRLGQPDAVPAIRQYWEIPAAGPPEDRSDESWIAECRERLQTAVESRLMSDVPLGMFLSGGVDSSAIAALMKRPLKTFAVGYREAAYSELGYARQVAATLGTDHHEIVIGKDDFFDALPRLIWHEDEPIAWPSSVSLYFVSKLAAEHVKVVLTGEGSDELFAGYGRYRFYLLNRQWLRWYRLLPGFARRRIRGAVELLPANLRRKVGHTFLSRGGDLESLYLDNFYAAFPSRPYDSFLRYFNARADEPLLTRLLFADQKTYLVELLMKQDQMSMAASIESRVPFLDHPLVEFAMRVPEHLKIRRGVGKYIVKKAAEDLLPPDILYRKKMGFPTPIREWLKGSGDWTRRLLDRDGFLAAHVDLAEVSTLLARHERGQVDATDRIWRLLNLQIWGDLYFKAAGR
jgi:asparagine synthase (glutamine-hydrolysing)